jgi:signal transduction histidine kinase
LEKAFISYPVLIKIIVENLIENAIDFSTPDNPRLNVFATSQNGTVQMDFIDNGEGIKDSIKPQIFEMFFRGSVRSAGNGLGLYIARKAAEKASGKISFSSNPNGGTTFRVEIPNNKIL